MKIFPAAKSRMLGVGDRVRHCQDGRMGVLVELAGMHWARVSWHGGDAERVSISNLIFEPDLDEVYRRARDLRSGWDSKRLRQACGVGVDAEQIETVTYATCTTRRRSTVPSNGGG